MPAGVSNAFALLRIPRGEARPSDERFRAALAEDHARLHQPQGNGTSELEVAGPYAILVDGTELDEYVVWER